MPFLPPVCDTPAHVAAHALNPPPVAAPRPPAAAPEVCVDPGRLARQEGLSGTYDQTYDTTHFHFAWDAANPVLDDATLAVYAEAAEAAWDFEIDELGWRAPDQTDACLVTILLSDFDDADEGTGGYTNADHTGEVPYIILNTDWVQYGDDWTKELVAHEFNHASQFGYNVFWEQDDWWYWESTAEWIPYELYDIPDVAMWSVWYYVDAPWRGLESNAALAQYGHFVFNQYVVDEHGLDAPRAIWATAGSQDHVADAFETALAADGVTWNDTVAGFASHAAAVDVRDPDMWLEALGYFEVDPYAAHVTAYPAEGASPDRGAPERWGQSFVHFAGDPGADVTISFAGAPDVGGAPTEWVVTVAALDADGSYTHTATSAAEDGTATVTLPLAESTDVYVAFVPMGDIDDGATYTWTADVAAADDTGVVPISDEDDGGDDEKAGGCGCDGTPGVPNPGWLVGLALLAARRR